MAGHSKWNNIKHRKNRQDAKKGKIFTKISKEIFQAVRNGGDQIDTNHTLRMTLEKARQANMPNENIERTIKKAAGNLEGISYEEIIYEGYAPHGVAVYVEVLTENKNRSAAEVRLAFNKNGGNLGESGCVSFMFQRKGYLLYEIREEMNEEDCMMEAIEAGAEDVQFHEDAVEIFCALEDLQQVKNSLQMEGLQLETAEPAMIPDTKISLNEAQLDEVMQLIEALEDSDDVQRVAHNAEM